MPNIKITKNNKDCIAMVSNNCMSICFEKEKTNGEILFPLNQNAKKKEKRNLK